MARGSIRRGVRDLPHLASDGMGSFLVRVSDVDGTLRRPQAARGVLASRRTGADLAVAKLTHLTYTYPGAEAPALRDVCLEIDEGLTVVTGPSGGGKSSLLRVFNGLVPHFHGGGISGSASVGGLDIIATNTRDLARHVGFVFQDPELQTVYNVVDR